MNNQTAIFDMDGTLIDSMYFWDRAPFRVLYDMGIMADDTDEEVYERIGFYRFPEYLVEKYGLPCSAAEFFARADELVLGHYRTDALLKPNAKEYLMRLKSRRIRTVILTASKPIFIETMARRFGLAPYLDASFSARELGIEKSEPDIYRVLFEKLRCTAEDCILFEDSVYSVKAAADAGVRSVGVLDPYFSRQHQGLRDICFRTVSRYSELLARDVFT